MPSGGVETPIPASVFARITAATRFVISGVGPESWFGPQQPLAPQAPPEVKGRQWDYPFGVNLSYVPRGDAALSFNGLRALADALPLLRAVIETRKDQIAGLNWTLRPRDPRNAGDAAPRIAAALAFLTTPDRRHDFATWLRMLIEDMLVIDAACLYPRLTRSGALYSLDVIDGATVKPLIGEDGRSPAPPDPAYQQVLHGVPAADFASDELIYLPRNVRSHRLYGMSPVEQIALTINIALRREQATLDYYNTGSIPDSFATLPKDWTVDQIKQFQDYFDALMSGNLARRRMVKFMPAEFKLTETRQPPLKDQYDEWLARVICYAFSVPASAFVTQVNRATSQTLRTQATQEGLIPLKAWVKSALDRVVQVCLKQPDLEFTWVGDDAIDPLEQAQTLVALVGAGIKTREEARADLGLAGTAKVAKFNPYHDEQGRFTTAEDAVEPGNGARARPDQGVQVAYNDNSQVVTDAVVAMGEAEEEPQELKEEEPQPGSGDENGPRWKVYWNPETFQVATGTEPPGPGFKEMQLPWGPTFLSAPSTPIEAEAPPTESTETQGAGPTSSPDDAAATQAAPTAAPTEASSQQSESSRTLAAAVAPNGLLPGGGNPGYPRTMPASGDPNSAASDFVGKVTQGVQITSIQLLDPDLTQPNPPLAASQGVVVGYSGGSYITYRPSGWAGFQTTATTASVDINNTFVNGLNGGQLLKLKFPKSGG